MLHVRLQSGAPDEPDTSDWDAIERLVWDSARFVRELFRRDGREEAAGRVEKAVAGHRLKAAVPGIFYGHRFQERKTARARPNRPARSRPGVRCSSAVAVRADAPCVS